MTEQSSDRAAAMPAEIDRLLREQGFDPGEVVSFEYRHEMNCEPEIRHVRLLAKRSRK